MTHYEYMKIKSEMDEIHRNGLIIDYKGNPIPVKDAVWCEYDKCWCNKKEALWEDIVGFYMIPPPKEEFESSNYEEWVEE